MRWPTRCSSVGGTDGGWHGAYGWSNELPPRARTIPSRFFKYRWVSQASKEGAMSKKTRMDQNRTIFYILQPFFSISRRFRHFLGLTRLYRLYISALIVLVWVGEVVFVCFWLKVAIQLRKGLRWEKFVQRVEESNKSAQLTGNWIRVFGTF